jgi:hypothetical protein
MRDVPYLDALSPVREIGARLTFTDYRLRFQYVPTSEISADYALYDACEYGAGILQAAVLKSDPTVVRFRYIADIDGTWPVWSTLDFTPDAVYHLALHAGRLFVSSVNPTMGLWRGDFTGTGFTGSVQIARYDNSLLAPVSLTDLYVLKPTIVAGKPYTYAKLIKVNVSTWAETFWYGRVYDTVPAKYMDAVRIGNVDTIYMTEEAGGRTVYVKNEAGAWSEKRFVIPLDVIDDVSSFRLSSATVLNGKPVVCGALSRSYGVPMHIYTFGPDRYTLGRDLFIGSQSISGVGKLHLLGSNLWYIGPGLVYKAPATDLVGYAGPSFQTEGVANIRASYASNVASSLTVDLSSDVYNSAIRPSSRVKLEVKVNDVYSELGNFSVDAVTHPAQDNGQTTTLGMRSFNMKELTNWESDAPYDYWSQTKLSTNPKDMAQVIRTTGKWKEEAGALTTYDLNKDGFLYTSAKSCHNTTTRAKFTRKSGDWNTRFGLGVNYSIETQAAAALRTGKDTIDITDADYGQNGIFAIFGKTEYDGVTPGVGLYLLCNSVWTKLTSESLTLIEDVETQAQIRFLDGLVQVHTRTSGAWTKVLEYTIESNDMLPWKVDYMGRGVVFNRIETPCSPCVRTFGNFIAVDSNTVFPASEILLIDLEQIGYTGKSTLADKISPVLPDYLWVTPSAVLHKRNGGMDVEIIAATPLEAVKSSKIRQKLETSARSPLTAGLSDSLLIYVDKIGNPTDTLKVSVMSSAMALKASKTISPLLMKQFVDPGPYLTHRSAWQMLQMTRIGLVFPKFTLAAGDYILFERTGTASNTDTYVIYSQTNIEDKTNSEVFSGVWGALSGTGIIPAVIYGVATTAATFYPSVPGGAVDDYLNGSMLRVSPYNVNYIKSETAYAETDVMITDYTAVGYKATIATALFNEPSHPAAVYPTLSVTSRGMNSTTQVEHLNTVAMVYRAGPFIYISNVEYFSSDYDLSLEDMTAEICGKAGVQTIESSLLYPTTITPSAVNPTFARRNVIAHLRLDNLDGTVVLEACKPTALTAGISLTINGSVLSVGAESFDTEQTITGNVSVSFFEQEYTVAAVVTGHVTVISVWQNGTFLHSFTLSDVGTGELFQIQGTDTTPIGVHISEGCMRIDNWILDNGKKGAQLIEELIGEKRFYFQDHNAGVRLFRTRTEVNAGTPYLMSVSESDMDSDVNLSTRVRVEGSDISEVMDEEMLIEYGNLFRLVHLNEINSPADAAYYAQVALDEYGSRYRIQNLQGAADPRIEPNDVIYVTLPSAGSTKVVKAIVDAIDYTISVDDSNAVFDMSIVGRVPRSEL